MKYDRKTKTVIRERKGISIKMRLSDVEPIVFWNWIKTENIHKGMFEDYITSQRNAVNKS